MCIRDRNAGSSNQPFNAPAINKLSDGSFLLLETGEAQHHIVRPFDFGRHGGIRPWRPTTVRNTNLISKISFDAGKRFLKESKLLPFSLNAYSSIAKIQESNDKGILFFNDGGKLFAARFDGFNSGFDQVMFAPKEGIAGKGELNSLPFGYYSNNKFLIDGDELIVPLGLTGVIRAEMR